MFRPTQPSPVFNPKEYQCFVRFMLLCNDGEISSSVVLITIAISPLTPNVNYSGRTAPLTSKVAFYIFIQQI